MIISVSSKEYEDNENVQCAARYYFKSEKFLAWEWERCVWSEFLGTAKVIAEGEDPKAERISTSLLEWTWLILIPKWETPVPFAIFIGCFPGFCVNLGLIVFTCNSENFSPSAEATCSFWKMPVSLLSELTSDWWRKKHKSPTLLYPVGETMTHSRHFRASLQDQADITL